MSGRNRSVTWSMSISVNGFISRSEQVCEGVCDWVGAGQGREVGGRGMERCLTGSL